ncbi:guanylate kinase 1-like [Asparagus officinalis]|uniref:guanylate kinase 1-like n=1 Tax=Asparagus officinalis TaxID=4686 RepID=UPI00098DEBF6|nr:guanylate kinase 1-like [Asparagus officinalis]
MRASSLEVIFVFIFPPSFDELEKRLCSRGTKTEEQVQKRLRNAKVELEQGRAPDNSVIKFLFHAEMTCLDETLDVSYDSALDKIPLIHSVSKKDQNLLINCGRGQFESSTPSMFFLNSSSPRAASLIMPLLVVAGKSSLRFPSGRPLVHSLSSTETAPTNPVV